MLGRHVGCNALKTGEVSRALILNLHGNRRELEVKKWVTTELTLLEKYSSS